MADLQGVKRVITEMALVCTEKQFADLCASDANMLKREYVRLNANQVRGELCGGVAIGELQPGSVAVVPFGCSAHYLSFLLCSLLLKKKQQSTWKFNSSMRHKVLM